ncbi:MAG TPA: RDD family protein [Anaerolineales bacterium]|nr:RDD family protein [Anaerolineales bacterium]
MKTYAGFWKRLKAFAFDYLVISIYLVIVVIVSSLLNSVFSVNQWLFSDRVTAQVSAFFIVTFPVMLYFSLGEASSKQATWGKQRLGLKVVDSNGDKISFWRALLRAVLKFIPWELSHTIIWEIYFSPEINTSLINYGFALVYVLIGLNIASLLITKKNQALYDIFARTYVTRNPS